PVDCSFVHTILRHPRSSLFPYTTLFRSAYFRTDGTFDFALPEKGELQGVQAAGPAGMPLTQIPIDKKNNRYSIAFAFRPGDNSRSEEHTSELQSLRHLVCRLLLEKKK